MPAVSTASFQGLRASRQSSGTVTHGFIDVRNRTHGHHPIRTPPLPNSRPHPRRSQSWLYPTKPCGQYWIVSSIPLLGLLLDGFGNPVRADPEVPLLFWLLFVATPLVVNLFRALLLEALQLLSCAHWPMLATHWPHSGHTVATQWPHKGHTRATQGPLCFTEVFAQPKY